MIKFNTSGQPPTPGDIAALETKIGHKLPLELVQAYSDPTIEFSYPNKFPIRRHENYYSDIAVAYEFSELADRYTYITERFGLENMLPVASDACGNFILISLNEKSQDYRCIHFFDYDTRDLIKIAEDIQGFIMAVECYTPSKLRPEELEGTSVAVSEEFRKRFLDSQ